MQFKLFSIPAKGDVESEEELSCFLRSHRAVSVQKQLVNNGGASRPCVQLMGCCWPVQIILGP